MVSSSAKGLGYPNWLSLSTRHKPTITERKTLTENMLRSDRTVNTSVSDFRDY